MSSGCRLNDIGPTVSTQLGADSLLDMNFTGRNLGQYDAVDSAEQHDRAAYCHAIPLSKHEALGRMVLGST